jgi:DNA-binding NarL/FixJ family response regulator
MPATRPLRVAIVEDDARYRDSLELLLAVHPGLELVDTFGSGVAALEALEGRTPASAPPWDLVLMDIDLPGLSGIETTRRLKPRLPELLVVVLTVFEEPARILEAICAGADGYLLKRTPPAELLEQLDVVAAGGAPLTAGVARTVLDLVRERGAAAGAPQNDAGPLPGGPPLSPREREVLRGLVDGLAYKQVADQLGVSLDTVRTHVRGLYRKLQVHSVAEAVGRALREGLV